MSDNTAAKTTVGALLDEVNAAFADSFTLPDGFLTDTYNHLAAALALREPTADGEMTVTAKDGKLTTGLVPAQYRRVFFGDAECLRGSTTLCALLPDFPICAPGDDGSAAVTLDGDYTIHYRKLPDAVTAESAAATPVSLRDLPYLHAALSAAVCRHIGDADAAAACEADAARALAARAAAGGRIPG